MRFQGEVSDLRKAIKIGEKWGFGNTIVALQYAWAEKLALGGLNRKVAATSARLSGPDVEHFVAGGTYLESQGATRDE